MQETIYQGVYVHTPFCVRKCRYCDFPSYDCYDEKERERYVTALCAEIAHKAQLGYTVAQNATLYLGGGTPTILTVEQIERIMRALDAASFCRKGQEATIEANPGTVDGKKLRALRQMGFNRISFGVQSLHDKELRALGRIHTRQEALEAITLAREAGFTHINADLMYGIPEQSAASFRQSLAELLALGLTHLSLYSLIIEEGTEFCSLEQQGLLSLPSEEETAEMYNLANSLTWAKGLQRYEISNYALPSEESAHNLIYWRYEPYLGLGAAATGFNGVRRYQNTEDIAQYCADPLGSVEIEELTEQMRQGEYLFMGLRTAQGINLAEAKKRFALDVEQVYAREIAQFTEEGLLRIEGGRMYLTELGMRFGNRVFRAFV